MSGKQSVKPRFGGVFFCLDFLVAQPFHGRRSQARISAVEPILKQRAQQLQRCLLALHITASFGVATTDAQTSSVDALYVAADTALYRAKAAGRNCVLAKDYAPTLPAARGSLPPVGSQGLLVVQAGRG